MTDGISTVRRGAAPAVWNGLGVSFGTFGELLQGALSEVDADFLVTLPIARWSTARISLVPDVEELVVEPVAKQKSLHVARSMLSRYGVARGGTLVLGGDLPEGKGMSSSSADLVATIRAVADALDITLTPREIEGHIRGVEPTDGVMYRDIVAFCHRKVELHRVLGPVPALTIVGIDEGGQVDTVRFNSSRRPIPAAHRREYGALLDELSTALAGGDLATVGRVATRSAVLNQERCHKTHLSQALDICRDVGGLGVAVAHSGTLVGILFAAKDPDHAVKVEEAAAAGRAITGAVSIDHTLRYPSALRERQSL